MLGALALALAALALSVSPALASTESLLITGAGDGHGVGMSQEGALGYAEHGATYEQILAHYYTGTALGQAPAGRMVKVLVGSRVKTLPLETYVRGVVAAEMPSSWPLAALEAQAVASRTYALTSDAGGQKFDVYADTRSQMYEGAAAETASSNAAIADTAGQIVTYEGMPVTTYFFASSGGMTESVQNSFLGASPEPWLIGVADPYDQGPLHTWKVALSFATATSRLRGVLKGSFRGIEVLKRGVSPRIVSAYVIGSRGRTLISGPELAARLGLDSTWEYFSVMPRNEREARAGREWPGPLAASDGAGAISPGDEPSGWRSAPPAASAASTAETGGDECRMPPARAHRICVRFQPLAPPDRPHSNDEPRSKIALFACATSLALPAAASAAHSVGTSSQISWVRTATTRFVTAELKRDPSEACAVLDGTEAGDGPSPHVRAALEDRRSRRCCMNRASARDYRRTGTRSRRRR